MDLNSKKTWASALRRGLLLKSQEERIMTFQLTSYPDEFHSSGKMMAGFKNLIAMLDTTRKEEGPGTRINRIW